MAAKWSEKRQQEERAERMKAIIDERLTLIERFRKAGWIVETYIEPATLVDDNAPILGVYWFLKAPGFAPVIERNMDGLRRKAIGL